MIKSRRVYERIFNSKRFGPERRLRPGLKKVNIGNDIWLFGRQKMISDNSNLGKKINHMVIYGPENKEYHVYGESVNKLKGTWNRDGNLANESLVKIFILTSILDSSENWNFDLSIIPKCGKLKVIYENGMVRNVDFDGEFRREELISKRYTWKEKNLNWNMIPHSSMEYVLPVGYRII